ncbi:MAG: D-alanyl-D-alanine carboxypeptidase [Alphaproteobacteria bacterium]|nr:D-alanyl-D-alanine carboxypeptidase [Alphaproteobacteria bacterium]
MKSFTLFFYFFLLSSPLFSQKYADILMDAETGEVFHQVDADAQRFPASLTKILTLYVIFEKLKSKKITMDTQFTVPKSAPIVEPCKLGLRTGQKISVRHIIMGMITKSANDASVTAAVGISGSIEGFSKLMNATALKIGMKNSRFYNPHGLPDPRQLSTAKDMAILSRALVHHFPEYYSLFKTRVFTYMGHCHTNHNHLLGQVEGLDGIKTGWFRRAGSNLAASAVRTLNGKKRRLIAVVLGGESRFARDRRIKELLEIGFKTSPKGKMIVEPSIYQKKILPSANLDHHEDPIGDLIHNHHPERCAKKVEKKLRDLPSAKPLGQTKALPTYVWVKGTAPIIKNTQAEKPKRIKKIIRRIKRIKQR